MTPLAAAVLTLLESEREYPPLSVEKITFCLNVTGQAGHDLTVADVESALAELMAAGQVERVHSARLGARYRAMVEARPVAAGGTDRT